MWVSQGLVLGPLLCNVYYDRVLMLELPDNVKTKGYADDLALVVSSQNRYDVQATINEAVSKSTYGLALGGFPWQQGRPK